ncbi:BQ5605_C018g08630 [Microbotryum silenes-dioicae]|uniref:BQ5605_C018g08630 protein n=1 Tax=Microbotryum silenes-dioicae TaxID=796604 RepID=A0A2X0LWJ4_9BASI|nr:BQ5605_C018g08630 [Microbotryum silenes-dioicae]
MSHLIHLTSAYEIRTMDLLNTLAQPYAADIPLKEFVNKVKIAMTDFQELVDEFSGRDTPSVGLCQCSRGP